MGTGLERGIERVAEDRQHLVDRVTLGVRLADEPRLARVGLGHGAAGVHPDRDRVVQLVIGVRPVAVLGRLGVGEHDPEHRRVAGEDVRQAGRVEDLAQAVLQPPADGVDRLERRRVAQDLERLHGRRGGDPVAGVRAAVADLVGQDAHDLLAPAERGRRVAVAHRLGVGRKVRLDPEVLGGAAAGEAEPGLDLVEDQQDPELLGQLRAWPGGSRAWA